MSRDNGYNYEWLLVTTLLQHMIMATMTMMRRRRHERKYQQRQWRTMKKKRNDIRRLFHTNSRRATIASRNDITQLTFSIALIIFKAVQLPMYGRPTLF